MTAVDIDNWHGSVTLVVDPRIQEPLVHARAVARGIVGDARRNEAVRAVDISSEVEDAEPGRVLRIRAVCAWEDPAAVWADITVRVPSLQGVRVINRGGPVDITGVEGGVEVRNAGFAGSRGDITLRTARPMTAPVTLHTTEGSVVYQVGPDSSGQFLLEAPDVNYEFTSADTRVRLVQADGSATRVSVNDGENPVHLRSEDGWVRAMILADPQAYRNSFR